MMSVLFLLGSSGSPEFDKNRPSALVPKTPRGSSQDREVQDLRRQLASVEQEIVGAIQRRDQLQQILREKEKEQATCDSTVSMKTEGKTMSQHFTVGTQTNTDDEIERLKKRIENWLIGQELLEKMTQKLTVSFPARKALQRSSGEPLPELPACLTRMKTPQDLKIEELKKEIKQKDLAIRNLERTIERQDWNTKRLEWFFDLHRKTHQGIASLVEELIQNDILTK